jgi:hypothetical protein
MRSCKRVLATLAIGTFASIGLSGTALAAGAAPEPAFDPCPDNYQGYIVGYDDSNGTGKRVYLCIEE